MQAMAPEDNSFFPEKKKSCLGRAYSGGPRAYVYVHMNA